MNRTPKDSLPEWFHDSDVMRKAADRTLDYFNGDPWPVIGVANPRFRIVQVLDGPVYFASPAVYAPKDRLDLGSATNTMDGQRSNLWARVLRSVAPGELPPKIREFLCVYSNVYEICAD